MAKSACTRDHSLSRLAISPVLRVGKTLELTSPPISSNLTPYAGGTGAGGGTSEQGGLDAGEEGVEASVGEAMEGALWLETHGELSFSGSDKGAQPGLLGGPRRAIVPSP